LLISTKSITLRLDHDQVKMVIICPNIHCGQQFKTAHGLSNHVRSQKCKRAKEEAAAAAQAKRRLTNEQELANAPSNKRRHSEHEQEIGEGSHDAPENIAIIEVTIRFHDPINLKLISFAF
jgi:hypothetical protein